MHLEILGALCFASGFSSKKLKAGAAFGSTACVFICIATCGTLTVTSCADTHIGPALKAASSAFELTATTLVGALLARSALTVPQWVDSSFRWTIERGCFQSICDGHAIFKSSRGALPLTARHRVGICARETSAIPSGHLVVLWAFSQDRLSAMHCETTRARCWSRATGSLTFFASEGGAVSESLDKL
jgi:hypothetical protein